MSDQPAAAPTVFQARGLRKVYQTGEVDVVALHGVDVEFRAGELVVLLGACALLSTLARAPIRQAIAVTGSVDQRGLPRLVGAACDMGAVETGTLWLRVFIPMLTR